MLEATERFLAVLQEWADATDLARRVAVDALQATPEAGPEPQLRSDLEALSVESLRSLLDAIREDVQVAPTVPPAAVEFAKLVAQRRLGLSVLVNTYRTGHASFWRNVMEEAATEILDADMRSAVLMRLWDRLNRWMDYQVAYLSEIHETERDRFVRGALARKIEIVNAIVAGETIELDRTERALGYDLQRHQTALVMWRDRSDVAGDTLGGLELLAHQLAGAVDASRPLLVPSGSGSLWAWVATHHPPSPGTFDSAPALQDGTLRAAIGRTGRGLSGFRDSHREALAAQRIALVQPGALTAYADVELLSLLSQDAVAARTLVVRELADLSGDDRTSGHLRATALAYLLAGGNAAAAARELGVHKNTVHYRLRRVEELLGHPLEPGDTKLQLALQLAAAFGSDMRALLGR